MHREIPSLWVILREIHIGHYTNSLAARAFIITTFYWVLRGGPIITPSEAPTVSQPHALPYRGSQVEYGHGRDEAGG